MSRNRLDRFQPSERDRDLAGKQIKQLVDRAMDDCHVTVTLLDILSPTRRVVPISKQLRRK